MGLTKAKLLETAAYYRNLLEREKAKFDEALETQTQQRVHSKTADINRLQDQIARHQAEINRLQEEIVQYTDRKQAAETSLQQEQEKLHKTHGNFEKPMPPFCANSTATSNKSTNTFPINNDEAPQTTTRKQSKRPKKNGSALRPR